MPVTVQMYDKTTHCYILYPQENLTALKIMFILLLKYNNNGRVYIVKCMCMDGSHRVIQKSTAVHIMLPTL